MKIIGIKFLRIKKEELDWIAETNGGNQLQYKTDVLIHWRNRPGNNKQVKSIVSLSFSVFFFILRQKLC